MKLSLVAAQVDLISNDLFGFFLLVSKSIKKGIICMTYMQYPKHEQLFYPTKGRAGYCLKFLDTDV